MKSKKSNIYLILTLIFALLLAASVAIAIFAPASQPEPRQFDRGSDMQEFPAFPGENGSAGEMPERPRDTPPSAAGSGFLSTLRGFWLPLAAVGLVGAAVFLTLFLRSRRPDKKPASTNSMPDLELEDDDIPNRGGSPALWVTGVCVVLAIALIVSSLPSGITNSVSVNTRVLSDSISKNTISTVLTGTGVLTAQEGDMLQVPQSVKITACHVKNGEPVSEGDPIATVDKVSVASAISELQEVLSELDSDINSAYSDKPSAYIKAPTGGRVKMIYAEKGASAAETVYAQGALILLSLDGTMAVDIPQALTIGDSVTVTLSDGSTEEGRVAAFADGVSTVTISDETAPLEDAVTVCDQDGKVLDSGTLYIHSMLKVTGHYGTVSDISTALNRKVSSGATLITLKDTGHTAEYESLLEKRKDLEEQMDLLVALSQDGILRATSDGIISNVDKDIDYVSLAAPSKTRSQATPGFSLVSTGIMLSNPDETSEDNPDENPEENPDKDPEEKPEDPNPPAETKEYQLGYVMAVQDGVVYYIPQHTVSAAEGESFAGWVSQTVSKNPMPLSGGGTVLISADGAWTESSFESIAAGDALLIGDGVIIHEHGAGSGTGGFPGGNWGDLIGGMSGMGGMGGMSGMSGFGGMSGMGTASLPVYESYDLTKTDVALVTPCEEMTISILVDELDILTLRTGMEAQITLDALPGQSFTGTITNINVYGTNEGGNTKYAVTVTLPRTEKMLDGMNASVRIVTAVSGTVDTIPAAALQEDSGKSYVYTAYDSKTDTLSGLTEVETGISDGNLVEILSGLSEDDTFYYRYADSIEYSFVG